MKRPFFPLFILTILSLILTDYFKHYDTVIPPLIFLLFLTAVSFYFLKYKKFAQFLFCLGLTGLMCLNYSNYRRNYSLTLQKNNLPTGEYLTVAGTIKDFPVIGVENTVFTLVAEKIVLNGVQLNNSNINLGLSIKGRAEDFAPGEKIEVDCVISRNDLRANFYNNPLENYLFIKNIHFNAFTKSPLMIRKVGKGNLFYYLINHLRKRVRSAIEHGFMRDNRLNSHGQLLEALLLGDRRRLDTKIKENMISGGIFHLFAISGAHIGIIAFFLIWLLNGFRVRKKHIYTTVIVVLVLFLSMTGFKISAQRAVLTAVFVLAGKIFGLKTDPVNIVSASGIIILLLKPPQFMDPGFVLTFFITIGILSGRRIIFKDPLKIHRYISEFFVTNISASVVSIPLSIYFFKRYSFAGFFASVLLIPLIAVIMSVSIVIVPIAVISTHIASFCMGLLKLPIYVFFKITWFFGTFDPAVIYRPTPPVIVPVLFFIPLLIPLLIKTKLFWRRILSFLPLILAVLLTIRPARYSPEKPEFYFLDVGQGDCEIVAFPGGRSLLIDAGGSYYERFEVGRQIVLPFIIQKRIHIEWISISHFHPDHARGILEIVNVLKPKEIWISSFPEENGLLSGLMEIIPERTKIVEVERGFVKKVSGTEIKCLYPEKVKRTFYEVNDNSQVLKITGDSFSFLFTGDIEKKAEQKIVSVYGDELKCSVLKSPHHGSNTSSGVEFIRSTSSGIVIISVSENNRFGFPHSSVLNSYGKIGASVLATSKLGGIMISFKKGKPLVKRSKFNVQY